MREPQNTMLLIRGLLKTCRLVVSHPPDPTTLVQARPYKLNLFDSTMAKSLEIDLSHAQTQKLANTNAAVKNNLSNPDELTIVPTARDCNPNCNPSRTARIAARCS